jgi:hypothetical protein
MPTRTRASASSRWSPASSEAGEGRRRCAARNDARPCSQYASSTSSFPGARRASPESILPIVVMDSGLARSARPGRRARLGCPLPSQRTSALPFKQPDMTSQSRGMTCPSDAAASALKGKRAQGRPGASRTHGPRAAKKHAAEPQVRAEHPAFPARWCYGLYVIFPGTGLIAPVAHDARRASRPWRQHRDARTTRLRRPQGTRSSGAFPTAIASRFHVS